MATSIAKIPFTFRDHPGRTARDTYLALVDDGSATLNPGAWAGNMGTLLAAMTNAHVSSPIQGIVPPTYGANTSFPSAQDKATFIFYTAQGDRHIFQVPAPIGTGLDNGTGIFLGDFQTVDKTVTVVAAYIAYVQANVVNGAKVLLTEFIAGFRERRKLPRRATSLVLSPGGTTPEE